MLYRSRWFVHGVQCCRSLSVSLSLSLSRLVVFETTILILLILLCFSSFFFWYVCCLSPSFSSPLPVLARHPGSHTPYYRFFLLLPTTARCLAFLWSEMLGAFLPRHLASRLLTLILGLPWSSRVEKSYARPFAGVEILNPMQYFAGQQPPGGRAAEGEGDL